ncbi:hypothetical protein RhiirA1_455920 [Rhizophagus irregularis]|uniref:Uncharacterized protein n=1 Tax=Rhizophagus irregularis TaxID=588596 RepID=A0A2N0S1T2_9GLOM|nr:hypothetical protein RhiirA1_455920 [Rhizophagus irregularis]
MSSKNYDQKTRGTPPYHVQKIRLDNNANRLKKRKFQKACPDCKETSDSVKLFSSKVNKIEEVIKNYYKTPLNKNKNNKTSIFNAKFTLNNIQCELEYDLSKFTLENLQKLVIFTTQNCNINDTNNKNPSSISSDENLDISDDK